MDALKQFSIPIKSIGNTTHQFDFQVGEKFFSCFEESLIQGGKFDITLKIDKRATVMDLKFIINGSFQTECDRCLANIHLKVVGEHDIIARYGEAPEEENPEVIFIHPLAHDFNIAKYVYEFICLSIPYAKVCEGDDKPLCDDTVQDYLGIDDSYEDDSEEEDESNGNPFLDVLKDIDLDH
jgi:uncharacterized protein